MYISADASDEVIMTAGDIGSGRDTFGPRSIESVDVKKAGMIVTKTPDTLKKGKEGRERLVTFLDKVEANIAKEVESRKKDIAAIRQQMAKNMELNQASRAKMKKMLLTKMAKNAKIAKQDLATEMRRTQKKFAEVKEFENKRNHKNIKRNRKTREIMRKNKREGKKNLANAVAAQQRALAALDSATNDKIKKTNAHIHANAAQIKSNAAKARRELEHQMNAFKAKMANVREEAKKGRSKLAAQANAQDKKFRQYANNKIAAEASKTAAQFAKVRDTMAKDRANADAKLSATSAKMHASLNAAKALQDKRFAQTVSDIKAAKKEANDRVAKFTASYKADVLHLSGVVQTQSTKLNNRMTQLQGVVANNKLAQAKVNNQVNAELKRIMTVGNQRYKAHLKKDKELSTLMAKNKSDTEKKMKNMSMKFYSQISAIKKQMAKDRAHAEHRLSAATGSLFTTLAKNKAAQEAVNKGLTAATRRAALDAAAALKTTKADFSARVAKLHTKVKHDERKHNSKVMKLTGIVAKNAIKDAAGRAELSKVAEFNKNELKTAVRNAVAKGEARALQIEKKMKDVNKKTRASLNNKISTEISALTKSIHGDINELNLQTKSARAEMKKEIQFAIKSAATMAKQNLKNVIAWSEGEFTKLNQALQTEKSKSAGARAALQKKVDSDRKHALGQIANAVAAQEGALLALAENNRAKIKKTNKDLTAHADQMIKNAKSVAAQMKNNNAAIQASLESARKAADNQLGAISAASVARYNSVVKAVEDGLTAATAAADARFEKQYIQMATDRKNAASALSTAVNTLNKRIASAAALEDQRFSKTVKDVRAARIKARSDVADARKMMKSGIFNARAQAKKAESNVINNIQTISAMIVSDKAAQLKINNRVKAEMKRILKSSDEYESNNKKARGVIKKIMNENKAAAAEEVANLFKRSTVAIAATESQQARYLSTFKTDLTDATDSLYGALTKQSKDQEAAMSSLQGQLAGAKAGTAAKLKSAKTRFASRMTSLTNAITANAKHFENRLARATGVKNNWKKASAADRKAIRAQRNGMVAKLQKSIARAISLGEAKRKAVEESAMVNIATEKKALMTTISASVENMADNVFALVQGNRQKIADNYLSLKAYTASAADSIADYLQKGKTRNLASIGDLLETVSAISRTKSPLAEGEGFGSKTLPLIFSGKNVKVDNSVSKINGLVNEYVSIMGQLKNRWQMGLGKYLLCKLEMAMQKTGALEVDKVEDKSGNFVFMNAHAVGLSSKLSDFQGLAVQMSIYEQALAQLTGTLSTKKTAARKKVEVPPPEWQGN
jgi:hypothetical protein